MATVNLGFRYVRHDTFDKTRRMYVGKVIDTKTGRTVFQTIPYRTREQCGSEISHWILGLCPNFLAVYNQQWATRSGT